MKHEAVFFCFILQHIFYLQNYLLSPVTNTGIYYRDYLYIMHKRVGDSCANRLKLKDKTNLAPYLLYI